MELKVPCDEKDITIRVSPDGRVMVWRGNQPLSHIESLLLQADNRTPFPILAIKQNSQALNLSNQRYRLGNLTCSDDYYIMRWEEPLTQN